MPQVIQTNTFTEVSMTAAKTVSNVFGTLFSGFLKFFDDVSTANSRVTQIERMQNLTDKELADQYRINRDQIVSYVFRDKLI